MRIFEINRSHRRDGIIKRTFDVLVSVIALVILLPTFIIIAFQVGRKLGTPVLFRQTRAGLYGRSFELIKFRTMLNTFDDNGDLLPDAERLTPFGQWLRRSSFDELPELINVLKGDMSLVGPRPLLIEYLPLYSAEQACRHSVRPGLTGWAQINGRNTISWDQKFKMDVWYVSRRSFWLDLKIIFLTVGKVLSREGVSPQDEVTMPRFDNLQSQKKTSDEK